MWIRLNFFSLLIHNYFFSLMLVFYAFEAVINKFTAPTTITTKKYINLIIYNKKIVCV